MYFYSPSSCHSKPDFHSQMEKFNSDTKVVAKVAKNVLKVVHITSKVF